MLLRQSSMHFFFNINTADLYDKFHLLLLSHEIVIAVKMMGRWERKQTHISIYTDIFYASLLYFFQLGRKCSLLARFSLRVVTCLQTNLREQLRQWMKHDYHTLDWAKRTAFMFLSHWEMQNVKISNFNLYFLRCFGSMHSFTLIP